MSLIFYFIQDVAASPPTVDGLAITAVNISYGLDLILKEKWKSDREFQEAVALLLDKVQDAHLVNITIYIYIYIQIIQLTIDTSLIRHFVIVNSFSGNLFN